MPYTRPSVPEDVTYLAPRLRSADVREIEATGMTPEVTLQLGLTGTECLSIITDAGEVIGMFGIHHLPEYGPDQACIWLLASEGLVGIQREFMRQTRAVLDKFHQRFPVLWNLVDSRNTVHIRWLRYFGFSFITLHPSLGPQGIPFYEFVRLPNV